MSDPADNPYQSPRGVEAPNAEARADKGPWWGRRLRGVAGAAVVLIGMGLIYLVIAFLAALSIVYLLCQRTVLALAAFGIFVILLVVAEKIRERLKRDDR